MTRATNRTGRRTTDVPNDRGRGKSGNDYSRRSDEISLSIGFMRGQNRDEININLNRDGLYDI